MHIYLNKLLALIACLFIFSMAIVAQSPQYSVTTIDGKEFYLYTIDSAEGFFALRRKFNVTQQEIENYNPETKGGLKNGQRILIPVNPSIPITVSYSDEEFILHTIQPKETLYSVARMYEVSTADLIAHNEGLSEGSFPAGVLIRIRPKKQKESSTPTAITPTTHPYKVEKKETLYSISRKFEISLTDLLNANPGIARIKAGDLIQIPSTVNTGSQEIDLQDNSLDLQIALENITTTGDVKYSKIVLLLPLQLNKSNPNSSLQGRYLEFYEGFLIAVDSLKNGGASFEISVFDTDSESIERILSKPALAQADLIIGPAENNQITEVAKFANSRGINVVNPFTFDPKAAELYPHLFQLNTPNSYLFSESAMEFARIFRNHSVVFLKEANGDTDKKDFIDFLRRELINKGISFADFEYTDTEHLSQVDSLLQLSGEVVFVPLSSSKATLTKILPTLHILKRNNNQLAISLFGYPEWQTFTSDFMDYFYDLNTYLYTRIYVNPFAFETRDFQRKYKYWYSKELMPLYPKFGMLGFDTGIFFLKAIHRYGKSFDNHIESLPAHSTQTAIYFRRINDQSGFVNKCIYFVNFRPDSTIKKTEVK